MGVSIKKTDVVATIPEPRYGRTDRISQSPQPTPRHLNGVTIYSLRMIVTSPYVLNSHFCPG